MSKNQNEKEQQLEVVASKPVNQSVVTQLEHFSGPLPHPEILARYNEIVPGAAQTIVKKFENQTDHRIKIETIIVWTGSIKEIGGLISGFIIALITISGGIYTALQGSPFLGGSLSFAGLALIVGAFVASKFKKQKAEDT